MEQENSNYWAFHLKNGQVIVGERTFNSIDYDLVYPMQLIQNPQVTPQGGIHIVTLLVPLANYCVDQTFAFRAFVEECFIYYAADQDLIEMYKKMVSNYRAKKSGIVVPELR